MDITKRLFKNELTMRIEGEIDSITAIDFENEINEEMGNFDSLVLDFKKLEFLSSAGLRVLITVQKKLKSEDISLKIINVSPEIKDILSVSGLDQMLNIQ